MCSHKIPPEMKKEVEWHDQDIELERSWSPLGTEWWYKLPKVGDIVGRLSVSAPKDTEVSMLIAGEGVWSGKVDESSEIEIGITVNMLVLGYHPAIIKVSSCAGRVRATYRVLEDTIARMSLATIETRKTRDSASKWYETDSPSEWQHSVILDIP